MPNPQTFYFSSRNDVINIPADHGFYYLLFTATGFDTLTSTYRYRLPNNVDAITVSFRGATQAEMDACVSSYPTYNLDNTWIPIVNGVEPYSTSSLFYVSGANYGRSPFAFCAAAAVFSSVTLCETAGNPAVVEKSVHRLTLRGFQSPAVGSPLRRKRARRYNTIPPGYIRVNLREGSRLRTPSYITRTAGSQAKTVGTTGSTSNPPTLNPPASIPSISAGSTFCLPSTISASNAGPWYDDRPGYICTSSPRYGDGNFSWSAAAATRRGNKWTGPNMPNFSFDGFDANGDEIWTLTASGWAECQNPIYSNTKTKSRTASSITFDIGSGTVTIGFDNCNLNTGAIGVPMGTPSTSTTVNCNLSFAPKPIIINPAGCNCVNSVKTTLSSAGCLTVTPVTSCVNCATIPTILLPPPNTANPQVTLPVIRSTPVPGIPSSVVPIKAPPPPPPPKPVIFRPDGSFSGTQVVGPDFSRYIHTGRKYDLYQPLNSGSELHKIKKEKPRRLQENSTMRLAGAPLVAHGEQFGFITNDPEVTLTSFLHYPRSDMEDAMKKDIGKKWQMVNWEDFADANESDLLFFAQKFGILLEDLSTANGVQHIIVIGWVKYGGVVMDGNNKNYLIVYCNKSIPSSITAVQTLHNGYWVLIACDNDFLQARVIGKK